MAQLAPPLPPPRVILADDGGMDRVKASLHKLWLTTLTVLVTAWFCTLGPVSAILALVVAKHVLVAILVMGLGVDAKDAAQARSLSLE